MTLLPLRLIPAVLLLAACTVEVPPEAPPTPPAGTCGAADLQGLVGQPAAVLKTMRFSQETRIIRPGMAVTMDYRENRLNIEIDRAERISRVACG
ncbi:MAG: I78 family peptidase inhibitor [Gemmobacter sp.]